jgi:hypothetical protein
MTGTGRRPLNGRAGLKETSAETGWLAFAGVIMVLLGVSGSLQGFMCLFDQGYFLVSPAGLVVDVDYAAWGWTHLVLGLSIFAGGLGVLEGGTAVRPVAVVLAVLNALVNIAFMAAYPVWSTIMIALDVVVIYALCVHGRALPMEQTADDGYEVTLAACLRSLTSDRGSSPFRGR